MTAAPQVNVPQQQVSTTVTYRKIENGATVESISYRAASIQLPSLGNLVAVDDKISGKQLSGVVTRVQLNSSLTLSAPTNGSPILGQVCFIDVE